MSALTATADRRPRNHRRGGISSMQRMSGLTNDMGGRSGSWASGLQLNTSLKPVFLSLDESWKCMITRIMRSSTAISGWAQMWAITFLLMNDWTSAEEELVDLVLSVASDGLGKTQPVEIVESRCEPLEDV